jgi:hypothetical protein
VVFLPESPWHLARQGKVQKAQQSLKTLYGGVPGYDIEREYSVMASEIDHANSVAIGEHKGARILEIFRGVNLVRLSRLAAGRTLR